MHGKTKRIKLLTGIGAVAATLLLSTTARTQAPSAAQADQAAASAAINQYCLGCHNAKAKTAGVVLDPAKVADVGPDAELWERVVHQLEAQSMPPTGMPRPDAATYKKVASYLETSLDAAAAAHPNPGELPQLHRLTRTEYANAIRDLLGLTDLPKEMDYTLLLPADNSASGFDNIADLLYVSPAILERYLDAARKISRLAVGDPQMPVMVNIYGMPLQQPQDVRVEELPVGTRGGLAIETYFPLDAEYTFDIQTAGRAREQHELEITVDGERRELTTVGGGNPFGRGGRGRGGPPQGPGAGPAAAGAAGRGSAGANAAAPGGPAAVGRGGRGSANGTAADAVAGSATGAAAAGPAGRGGRAGANGAAGNAAAAGGPGGRGRGAPPPPPEHRLAISAGPHLIGITFIQKSEALDEATLRPRLRGRGSQPAIGEVTIRGPYHATGSGNTPSRQRIFTCHPANEAAEPACAKEILSTLLHHAYRRPVTAQDVADLMPFYEAGRKERDFELGIQRSIERLLVSPQFLYRIERDPANAQAGSVHRVSDLELASRLSFFLWSSIPDDELLKVAEAGTLHQPEVLKAQTLRMLQDKRSESMVTNFASQWLYLKDVEVKAPDLFLFRDFDEGLRQSFERETDLFLDSIIREDRPVTELLTANYTFVNERLAKHYGIPNVRGADFRKVTFPEGDPRGGLLGQGGILTLTSYSTRTSPVLRGKYVLENLLASPPPPPPPNVPSLKTEQESGAAMTLREAMQLHRKQGAVCAGCHARMDPIGFAMEHFDAVGRYREMDGQNDIDTRSELPDGTVVDGMEGVKSLLLKNPERFVSAVAEKLLMYGISRNVQYYDQPSVRAIVREAAANDYKFSSLVLGVVESVPFQMREKK